MYQKSEDGLGAVGNTAALSLDQAIGPVFGKPAFGKRTVEAPWFDRFAGRFADVDLVPDLGARIGSREWWRGALTCGALCTAAILLSPGLSRTIMGAPAPEMTADQWERGRAQTIAPLAWGGDTGRRMAATDLVAPLAETPERPSLDLSATIGQGDGFARVLERAGVGRSEALYVADLVGDVMPASQIKPGTRMDITLGRRANRRMARPLDALSFRARFDLKLAIAREDGNLKLQRIPIAVDDTPLRIQGRVGDSLYRSARAAGAPAKAIEAYLRAIASRVSITRDVPKNATFDMIVEHRRAETGDVEVGKLLYAGLTRGTRKTQLLNWQSNGRADWYDAGGTGEKRGTMLRPVNGARQSSGFGLRRHPILGYSRMHKGLDFAAGRGTPIYATSDGIVTFAGRNGGYGNFVRIKHAGNLASGYAHMSKIVARSGARVRQGQVIGYVGTTGLSTGPHLHYEIYKNGVAINPKSVSFTTTAQLAGNELRQFKAKLSNLLAVRPGAALAKDEAPKAAEKAVAVAD